MSKCLSIAVSGCQLLNTPELNKGTAFSAVERKIFYLDGLLPEKIETLDEQVERAYLQYKSYSAPLQKNIFLHELNATNQKLFYRLVKDHITELLPILYTPTVGETVTSFNREFRHPAGLYIAYSGKERIRAILKNRAASKKNIDVIVATDGERILGLGDQGVGGIHIPIAKLMLYSVLGGIDPNRTLPIVLDVGTNNLERLNDPMYLGWRNKRIHGKEYDAFIADFVAAVKEEFPGVYLHWEDFGRDNAARNLKRFRSEISSFNDDIQGTAVVTLAALLSALCITHQTLQQQRIVIMGAGSAGTGVAEQIVLAMRNSGMREQEILASFWLLDKDGLLTDNSAGVTPSQQQFLRNNADIKNWQVINPNNITLAEVVAHVKPTILIGCSGVGGAFSEAIIANLAGNVAQPIIFTLSNPTDKCEAKPADLIKWTRGRALVATGSPFAPVKFNGKLFPIAQCNNIFSFPGIGLGVIATRTREVSDAMLWEASKAIVKATQEFGDSNVLLPEVGRAGEVALQVAKSVALEACREGLANIRESEVDEAILKQLWEPKYCAYIRQEIL